MRKPRRPRSHSAALQVSFSVFALFGLLAWGCSGPQPLSVAMRRNDEQSYRKYLGLYRASPRGAFFAWKASYTGSDAQTLAKTDEQISSTRNPFDAHRNPDAVSRGAVIYKAHCLSCHGENVDGQGPALLEPTPKLDFHSFGKRFAITLHSESNHLQEDFATPHQTTQQWYETLVEPKAHWCVPDGDHFYLSREYELAERCGEFLTAATNLKKQEVSQV